MLKKLLIRTDGSREIGFGHIVRAATIARNLPEGWEYLIYARNDEKVVNYLESNGFNYDVIPPDVVTETEAGMIIDKIKEENTSILMLDIRDTEVEFIRNIRRATAIPVITFDDLGSGRYEANHVFDANLSYEDNDKLPNPSNNGRPVFHLGPEFIILNPQILDYRFEPEAVKDDAPFKILVAMGGADTAAITSPICKALSEDRGSDMVVRAIQGPGARPDAELEKLCESDERFKLIINPPDLIKEISRADLVIGGGGVTLFETACLGKPVLIYYQAEHQKMNAKVFINAGAAVAMGAADEFDAHNLQKTVFALRSDRDRRLEMGRTGRELVDGKGLHRFLEVIQEVSANGK